MEFKSFDKMAHFSQVGMCVTQKIHGTNAQIIIEDGKIQAASRTRLITPEDDNYGFAKFVAENATALIEALGEGRHFGEWAGPGINSGEGLKERTLVLFDFWRYDSEKLPKNVVLVPVIYRGKFDTSLLQGILLGLKMVGSKLVEGFMQVEGVVVSIGNHRYKLPFEAEETGWKKTGKASDVVKNKTNVDYSSLLQPTRLEKLLSRDERYILDYPSSLGGIVRDYLADLRDENQLPETINLKTLSGNVFNFVRTVVGERFDAVC